MFKFVMSYVPIGPIALLFLAYLVWPFDISSQDSDYLQTNAVIPERQPAEPAVYGGESGVQTSKDHRL